MVQIINDPNRTSASQWANSISQTLNGLAQQKIEQIGQRRLYDSLIQGGIDPSHARILTHLTPQERMGYFQRLGNSGSSGESDADQQQAQESQEIQSNLQQLSSPQEQQQQTQSPRLMGGEESFLNALQGQQQQPQQAMQQTQQAPQQVQAQPALRSSNHVSPAQNAIRTPSIGEVFSRPSPGEARLERRHQQTLSQADKHFIHKQVQPFISKHLSEDLAKTQEDAILKRIINVREKGKTRDALLTSVMRSAGIDFQALKNGDTLEIEKLGKFFLRGGPAMFGGKVSNFEAQNLLSQVPNELQTDEGSIRLANQMLNLNKSVHEENRIIDEIIDKNGGTPPLDLERQLARRMEPINERLAQDFIEGKTAYTTRQQGKSYTEEELSDAAKWNGKIRTSDQTGKKEISNGREWIPYKG